MSQRFFNTQKKEIHEPLPIDLKQWSYWFRRTEAKFPTC